MKQYDNYKNSGVEWLGEIPEHWEVKKLKHLIQSKTGYAFQSDKFSDEGIPLIRISDLDESGIVLLNKAPKLPQKNNLLSSLITFVTSIFEALTLNFSS